MTSARALVSEVSGWIERVFPDAERGERLRRALDARFGDDARPVTAELCREVEAVAHEYSRHLALEYVADGSLTPDARPPGWPPDRGEVERRAGQVRGVVRRPDGVGVLALEGLDPVAQAAPFLEAAFALLRGARGVVVDLRRNGGGDPGTLTLVLEWLLGGGPAHVSDVVYRDRIRQWWTTGRLGERALPADIPVAVLIGDGTFSSGEALAYHVQSRGRGRLVGGRTPGAADHVTPVNLGPYVRAIVPEGRVRDAVTGTNWEGTGVVPDLVCEPADALAVAVGAVGGAP